MSALLENLLSLLGPEGLIKSGLNETNIKGRPTDGWGAQECYHPLLSAQKLLNNSVM